MSTETLWSLASFGRQCRKILLQQDMNSAGWTGVVTLQPWFDTLNTNRGAESPNFISFHQILCFELGTTHLAMEAVSAVQHARFMRNHILVTDDAGIFSV